MVEDAPASSSRLPRPIEAVSGALDSVPGAGIAKKVAGGALDVIGSVSPRTRRVAVYAGVGVLGAIGVVEWPVAATVAAVAWLTQPRSGPDAPDEAGRGGGKAAKRVPPPRAATKSRGRAAARRAKPVRAD